MKKVIPLLLITLSVTISAHAASDPAQQALETLRRGFAGTTDFTADLTQEKQLSLMKRKIVSQGAVKFKKPDTFLMELYPPHASRFLLKDNVMTIRFTDQGVTDRVVLPPEDGLKKWFAYLVSSDRSLPDGVALKAERNGKHWTLQLYPKERGAVQQLTLSFDSEGAINRIVIEERNRDRTTMFFNKFRRNVGLRDKDFSIE
jgi:outer membrane lipoprotein carrier protein